MMKELCGQRQSLHARVSESATAFGDRRKGIGSVIPYQALFVVDYLRTIHNLCITFSCLSFFPTHFLNFTPASKLACLCVTRVTVMCGRTCGTFEFRDRQINGGNWRRGILAEHCKGAKMVHSLFVGLLQRLGLKH